MFGKKGLNFRRFYILPSKFTYMRKLLLLLVILASCIPVLAQTKGVILNGSLSVGKQDNVSFDTTAYADGSAWVEIGKDTTNKGIILPRVDVNSFTTTNKGVFLYDVNDSVLYHLDGTEKIRYLRQKDLAGALGQYFQQGGNSFNQSAILGTNDARNLYIKTNDSGRIRIDSFGRIKMGEVDKYRIVIDTAPGIIPQVWDTADRGNRWDYEWVKTKGALSIVYNNTDSMGATTIYLDNDCLEGGTGPRLRSFGRGSSSTSWGGALPNGRGSGNRQGGVAFFGCNGWADMAFGATGNNYSNMYFGSASGILVTMGCIQGVRRWSKSPQGVGIKYPYGMDIPADFSVRGNTVDSGKLIVTQMPYLPDSGVYNLLGHMPNTGLLGTSAIKANSTGFFIKGNMVDTGTVTITSTPLYSTGGYQMVVRNNTSNRLETIDSKPAYNYTPVSSTDPNGQTGDVTYDNTYMYIKTSAGWRRTLLQTF